MTWAATRPATGGPVRGGLGNAARGRLPAPSAGSCGGVFSRFWPEHGVTLTVLQALVLKGRVAPIRPRTAPAFVVSFPIRQVLGTVFRYDSVFGSSPQGPTPALWGPSFWRSAIRAVSEMDIKTVGESMAWIMALVFVAVYGLLAALVKFSERIMSVREGGSHG